MSAIRPDPAPSVQPVSGESSSPDLWSFCLSVYARPGVADACLTAQDTLGQDVPLLLWALWLGRVHGHRLTRAELDQARAAVAGWRDSVVLPLRTLRRQLKTGPSPAPSPATEALRDRIKAAELEAERLQLALLLADLPAARRPTTPPDVAMDANLRLLLPDAPSVTSGLQSAVRACD